MDQELLAASSHKCVDVQKKGGKRNMILVHELHCNYEALTSIRVADFEN